MEATLKDEYRALKETAAVVDFSDRGLIKVTGEDRLSFIHGMVTNDVTGIPENAWAYAALTTAKGAMVADARILRRTDALLLDVEPGFSTRVVEHLNKFLISEDAELIDISAERAVLGVLGPKALDVLRVAFPAASFPEGTQLSEWPDGTLCISHGLYGVPAYELFVPRNQLQAAKNAVLEAGAELSSNEALDIVRVEAGLGRMGQDMEESTIPLEANLERGISYNKGCYIGQEVIARATFRGSVNKKLVGLQLTAPGSRTELKKGEKVVGRITSAVDSPTFGPIALGYVHRTLLDPGTELQLASGGTAKVVALPFKA